MASDASQGGGGPREWATRVVQWNPARTAVKRGVHGYAAVRGLGLRATGRTPAIGNIFAASSPKAGSQWMKALFDHPVVRSHTGLFTLPQLDYQQTPHKRFPAGTFVPGIYAGYDEFKQLPRTRPRRVVYMFRDPRDLAVSGYYSAVKTHRTTHMAEVERVRDQIRALPFDEGLLLLIEDAAPRLREIQTWVDVDDPDVATFRLEDVNADPRQWVVAILKHGGVTLSPDELETVLNDVSREALQARDLAQREAGAESHYRVDRKSFRDVFRPEHYAAIEEAVPGLVARLGYPD